MDLQSGGLRDIGFGVGTKSCEVGGEERGLVTGAGDRDVSEAGVQQVWVDAGIGVNEDAFRGEALGTMASDSVAVVEMRMISGAKFDLAVVIETRGNLPIPGN